MEESAEKVIPLTLDGFVKDHEGCAVCAKRLSERKG